MAKEKQYVFSARTTEAGLKALNEVKARLKVSWDELVIEAVSAHYEMDKAMMTLPRKEKPAKAAQSDTEQPPTERTVTGQPAAKGEEHPTEGKCPAKKQKKGNKKTNSPENSLTSGNS